jgi:MHS family dicarboxylic acid transporter PcaT-like MFS transporter
MTTATPSSIDSGSTPPHYSAEEKRHRIFAIMAASSGNLVEWFDFYVYAFSSIYFAAAFSPKATRPFNCSTQQGCLRPDF